MENEDIDQAEPELIDKPEEAPKIDGAEIQIAALVSQYTDRPDLLLETLEKHDKGFVKRMNVIAERDAEKIDASKFNFMRVEAYATLGVRVLSALACLFITYIAVKAGAGFLTLIGIVVLYAVSQSGMKVFNEIGKGIAKLIEKFRS